MRFLVYAAPFLFSVVAAFILSKSIPPAHSLSVAVARLVVIAACSTVVLFGADRVTRRLLPLAALLGLTLVFPDEAPSRFKIAFVAGGTAQLERRLEEYRNTGATEPALAARRLLELVADLSQHDRLTRGHSERVRAYSQMIGEELGLTEAEIDSLRWAALLHDIGKLEIPFEILNKPGALTRDEYEVIKRHPGIGAELAAPLAGWLGQSVRAVGEHHERWDGAGYPNGLRGSDISIAARIVAVADTFDVMTSARSYRKPGTAAEARAELARCAGTQFDVNVVRAFLSISLGKLRLAMGPLSWLTQLAFMPTGFVGAAAAAPALMAAAGISAAALGTAVGPGLDFIRPPQAAAVSVVGSPELLQPASVTTVTIDKTSRRVFHHGEYAVNGDFLPDQPPSSTTAVAGSDPTTTSTISVTPTTTTTPDDVAQTVPVIRTPNATVPASTVARPAPSTTMPASAVPTSAVPAVTPPPTTAAPPTTPPPPPTTTEPVTTPPPTTVPPQPPGTAVYLLASSAAGNVASTAVLPLVARGPINTGTVPNLDTDRDDKPGRTIKKGTLLGLGGTDKLQRFRLDPAAGVQLNGPASLVLFSAAEKFHVDGVRAQAMLADCPDGLGACVVFATSTVSFTGGSQFTPHTFDFGPQTRTIAASRNLELWIVVTSDSDRDMWMAYDTTGYESALTLTS